ncbi:MAG TPA: hypothetical protein VFG63_00680 [Nocardioidaceae bacterium]|nr:hypothetical protein [Nocardioidaceae bacterium]
MTHLIEARERASSYTRRHWTAAVTLGALAAVLGHRLVLWSQDCDGMGCIGTSLVATAAGTVLVPVLAVLGLALVRAPRPVRCGVAGSVAGVVLASAFAMVDAAARGYSPGSVVPFWALLLAGVLAGPAGIVLAGAGFDRSQRLRVAVLIAVVFALATMPVSGQ